MLARFQILLPYDLLIRGGAEYVPWHLAEWEGMDVVIHPPARAIVDRADLAMGSTKPMQAGLSDLRPQLPAVPSAYIDVDGERAIEANLLVIDFRKESFDRATDAPTDPSVATAFEIANDVLARVRYLLRGPQQKPLDPEQTPYRLDYLSDRQEGLEPEQGKVRARFSTAFHVRLAFISPEHWLAASELGEPPPAWDELYLDALSHLPEVGPSVVLGAAALESFIDWALDAFVEAGGMDRDLYAWISGRNGNLALQPSERDQFDALLKAVSGHSLKEDDRLWERFETLRVLRNNIVHRGLALLKNGQAADGPVASALLGAVGEIIDRVEAQLPESKRRVTPARPLHEFVVRQQGRPPSAPASCKPSP